MKTSTIGRIKKILKIPLIILFYLGVWQLLSIIVDSSLLLPSPVNTLQRLFELIQKSETWKDIGNTFLRLLLGYGAGAFIGIVLAVITSNCHFLYELLSCYSFFIDLDFYKKYYYLDTFKGDINGKYE